MKDGESGILKCVCGCKTFNVSWITDYWTTNPGEHDQIMTLTFICTECGQFMMQMVRDPSDWD